MKNKPLVTAISLMGIGVIAGVFLVSSFSSNSISSLFAADKKLGAAKPPVMVDNQLQVLNNAFIAVSKAVAPEVVSITVTTESKGSQKQNRNIPEELLPFFNLPEEGEGRQPRQGEASGSGVFISDDGYIVTNNHVVESAKENGIRVITHDQHEYDATLIGRDPLTDLAVLKVNASGQASAFIANSDEVQVGEWVVAVGNPLGLRSTITAGIVSAIGRGNLGLGSSRYAVENFIQTDAAINPGNSGGGLFDLQGRLVGINTAIATRTGYYQGYGFAIPSNLMKAVISDIIEDGKVDRGYIGVQIKTVDETDAKAAGLHDVSGVLVNDVIAKSAAAAADMEVGDVILEVDGVKVRTSNELQSQVVLRRAGETVKLTIWRAGKTLTKNVTLRPRDDEESIASSARTGGDIDDDKAAPMKFDKMGFSVEPVNKTLKKELDIDGGVLVSEVQPYSYAARRGIRPGDVIVAADIDKKAVTSPKSLKSIFDDKDPGAGVLLHVKTKNGSRIVTLEIPRENG